MSTTTPVILLTITDPDLAEPAGAGLMLDLPTAVSLSYSRDANGAVRRRISDWTGKLYDELVSNQGDCISCTVAEDLPGAVQFLAERQQWSCIVAVGPATVSPAPLARAVRDAAAEGSASDVTLASVVAFVGLPGLEHDLLGDDLLDERGLALGATDRRSVGEALTSQLEYADVVVAMGSTSSDGPMALLRAVCTESTAVHQDWSTLDVAALAQTRHDHDRAYDRVHPLTVPPLRTSPDARVWTLELATTRPLDPERLLERIEDLGSGRIRGRGYFWLASRPDVACVWDASGGQLSIGVYGEWEGRVPGTRLLITGTHEEDRERIAAAFPQVCSDEDAPVGEYWRHRQDGFEPWLG